METRKIAHPDWNTKRTLFLERLAIKPAANFCSVKGCKDRRPGTGAAKNLALCRVGSGGDLGCAAFQIAANTREALACVGAIFLFQLNPEVMPAGQCGGNGRAA